MPRVDTSKLLPIEQAPKDGTWIWAYWPPAYGNLAKMKPEDWDYYRKRFPEQLLPARWYAPPGGYIEHWAACNRPSPGPEPTHFFPMTQPPMIEE